MEQRSPEWYQVRCGCITGTRFAKVMAATGTRTYSSLIEQLVAERRFGVQDELPLTPAMQWGIDHEPAARAWYSAQCGNRVDIVGFMRHQNLSFIGVSPDGLVGEQGMIEIKCPQPKAYRETVTRGCVPTRYIWQVQGQLWVCQRDYNDFVCFHPDFGGKIIRVWRDEAKIAKLHDRCLQVEGEVQRRLTLFCGQTTTVPRTARWVTPSLPARGGQPAVTNVVARSDAASTGISHQAPRSSMSSSSTQLRTHQSVSGTPQWVWVAVILVVVYWLMH